MRRSLLPALLLLFVSPLARAEGAHDCGSRSAASISERGPSGAWKPSSSGKLYVPGTRGPTIKQQMLEEFQRSPAALIRPEDRKRELYVPAGKTTKPLTVVRGAGTKSQVAAALHDEGHFEEAAKYNGHPTDSGSMPTPPERLRRGAAALHRRGLLRIVTEYVAPGPPRYQDVRVERVLDNLFGQGSRTGILQPVRRERQAPVTSVSANEAYENLGHSYDFFRAVMGRFSIDDEGNSLHAVTHQRAFTDDGDAVSMSNAHYNRTTRAIHFGDNPNLRFTATSITGHEFTHGVTAHTANLRYQGESGALNEHFSDVFGMAIAQWKNAETVDEANWDVGSDAFKLTASRHEAPIRSMGNPRALGQPAHMKDYLHTKEDNGGVHINSGIPNRAFYVAAMAMGGNVWERAAKIWYVTLRDYLDEDATFAKAARGTVHVAQQIYGHGSREHLAVKAGWKAVGIEVNDSDPEPRLRSESPTAGFVQRQ